MPEAAVHKHGDPHSKKYDISLPAQALNWSHMHPVSESPAVKLRSEEDFGGRVISRLAAHPRGCMALI